MVTTFSKFQAEVQELVRGQRWIFRGQADRTWPLETSLWRHCQANRLEHSLEDFKLTLDWFIKQASSFRSEDLSTLDLHQQIALAQHHGLPTPFLDWTESPYVACFFALNSRVERKDLSGPIRVWALRRSELPLLIDPTLDYRTGLVETSVLASRRLIRQFGIFTYQPDPGCLTKQRDVETCLQLSELDIEGDWPDVLHHLRMMGISGTNLLDSLDGIAMDAKLRSLAEPKQRM